MTQEKLAQAAKLLQVARQNATPIDSLPDALQPATIDESYELQALLNRSLAASLQPPAGYKIGCTTLVMQEYLGIAHPCKGVIFESTLHLGHATFDSNNLCRPGVECEIAVRLAHDMPAGQTYTVDNCDAFIGSTHCSIELVDDRWTDYQKVPTPTLIAENFFGAGCVLGEAVTLPASELQTTQGTLRINGHVIGSGHGSDILGHPHHALAWLANHQAQRDTPLSAGDVVSLGSVVKTHWLEQGDSVEIEFTGLGTCSLQLD